MAKGSIYPYELADGTTRYMAVYRTSNGCRGRRRGSPACARPSGS